MSWPEAYRPSVRITESHKVAQAVTFTDKAPIMVSFRAVIGRSQGGRVNLYFWFEWNVLVGRDASIRYQTQH